MCWDVFRITLLFFQLPAFSPVFVGLRTRGFTLYIALSEGFSRPSLLYFCCKSVDLPASAFPGEETAIPLFKTDCNCCNQRLYYRLTASLAFWLTKQEILFSISLSKSVSTTLRSIFSFTLPSVRSKNSFMAWTLPLLAFVSKD